MKTGPQKGRSADPRTFAEKAASAWGEPVPDWIEALAAKADATGLGGAGEAIDYSGSAVSSVIANKYQGDLERVEGKVRGALLGLTVECPVAGEMRRSDCLEWQKKPFVASSSYRVQMYRACRSGCPNSRISTKAVAPEDAAQLAKKGGQDGQ